MQIRPARPADAPAIARVHVDSWRETYSGLMPDDLLQRLSYAQREQFWRDALTAPDAQSFIYVVERQAGEVVGFAVAGPAREADRPDVGEIYAIYLLAPYQGKGWGRALFLTIAQELARRGMTALTLWVLIDNPTRGFYEAMGGSLGREKREKIDNWVVVEVAYDWTDLDGWLGG
jgi:GNAT superfamily N-acetyltransferase